jgi:hypothetical protein
MDFDSKLEFLFWNHFIILFTHFKVAKLITCLLSCLTLDTKHCHVSQCLWMRTKLLSLFFIMISKPWSFCWLRLCNFWTLLLIAMHISCGFCCRLLFYVLIFASKTSEILLMSKFLVFCGIVVFNVNAFKPVTWWKEHVDMFPNVSFTTQ